MASKYFVNCWSTSEHESHALWRIYCKSSEGVAVQTTFQKLSASVSGLPIFRVTYEGPGLHRQTPTVDDLVSKKRPMFAYEREVRIVQSHIDSEEASEATRLDLPLPWEPEGHLESIRVHPEADFSFFETVTAVIQHYAPRLVNCVGWSAMREPPPF